MHNVDAAVLREFDRLAADGGDPRVLVMIEIAERQQSGSDDVLSAIQRAQRGVLDHLAQLGVTDARGLVLSSAVLASLTRVQLETVADRPDVRRIHPAQPQHVTT
jgi:hypothetical protein